MILIGLIGLILLVILILICIAIAGILSDIKDELKNQVFINYKKDLEVINKSIRRL